MLDQPWRGVPRPTGKARRRSPAALSLATAWGLAALLAGCVSVNGTGAGGGAGASSTGIGGAASRSGEVVTASDESEPRRRARIRLELAASYFEQGQTTVALDEAKQALVADPNYADAFNLRGLIYMRLADPRLAEESFRRAQQLNPRDASTLHNFGWLLCQQQRYAEADLLLGQAAASPTYPDRTKSLMAQGLCQARAGRPEDGERLLARAYELDAGNPIIAYNLSQLLVQRGDLTRAQFYIRRLNNSEFANSESLWLGIKVERRLSDQIAMRQLADQLRRRYPQSRELAAYDRSAFDE